MSTKTTFKRIALVAVASLGFGTISTVPGYAAAANITATVAVANATATTAVGASASTTFNTVTTLAATTDDTVTYSLAVTSKPADSSLAVAAPAATDAAAAKVAFKTGGETAATGWTLTTSTNARVDTADTSTTQLAATSNRGTVSVTPDKPGIYVITLSADPSGTGTTTTATFTVYAGYSADAARPNKVFPTQGSNITTGWAGVAGGQATVRVTGLASSTTYYVTTDTGSIISGTEGETSSNTIGAIANTNGTNLAGGFNFLTATVLASDYMDVKVTDLGAASTTVTVKSYNASTGVATTFAAATVTWGISSVASAQYSLLTLNAGAGTTATGAADDTDATTVAKTAGTKQFTIQVVVKDQYNAALNAKTISASITGPGSLAIADGNGGDTAVEGRSLSQLLTNNAGSVTVFGDGTSGEATITISVGTVVLGTKTVTFAGTPAKVTVTQKLFVAKAATRLGAVPNATYTVNDGTTYALSEAINVNVTDSNDVDVVAGATVKLTSSDSAVIVVGTCAEWTAFSGNFECSVSGATGAAAGSSATVTVSVLNPVTALYDIVAAPITFKIGTGTISTEALTLDATSYTAGSSMSLTITAKDAAGNLIADGTASPAVSANKSVIGLPSASFYKNGVKTVTTGLYAPATPGVFTLKATSGNAAASVISVDATVETDVTTAAAADAAAEATDAANAATDAANAAAEAADAATAAAQDAADAVAALSTQVSEMVNALKKQITALTNLVIKIQKKVKA